MTYQERNKWIDPYPEIRGMLSGDAIRAYVDAVNLIQDERGNPPPDDGYDSASFRMHIGPSYYIYDPEDPRADVQELQEGGLIEIPPNSIVFVSTGEKINLPHYIAARFNLRVTLIYHGILLGTGPQVDPGFEGGLSCPLHNISNERVQLRVGTSFAIIDFLKTSAFSEASIGPEGRHVLEGLQTEQSLYEAVEKGVLRGVTGQKIQLFPMARRNRTPIKDYLPRGRTVSSSVRRIEERQTSVERTIDKVEETFKTFRWVSIAGAVIIALTLVVIGFEGWSLFNAADRASRLESAYSRGVQELLETSSAMADIQGELEKIKSIIAKHEQDIGKIEATVMKPEQRQNPR